MSNKQVDELTDRELRQLLSEIEQLNKEEIRPLSDEEVEEIETTYQTRAFSAEREVRHRKQLEELRQEWLSDTGEIESLISRAAELQISREDLARLLRLSLDVLFKLELHLITNPPLLLVRHIADELSLDIRSVQLFLVQPGATLDQVAASSADKPAPGSPQTWEEAVLSSDMSNEDKKYWLEVISSSQ